MNKIKIYENSEFGKIRVTRLNGVPWFIGKDVAEVLGYGNSRKAISDHVDAEDKGVTKCDTLGGVQDLTIINESGLYSLIMSSKLPTAKAFKHWVTSEILPSIRKNGGYIAGQEQMSDDELLAKALMVAQNKIAEKDKQIEQLTPKAIFADAVAASKTSILVGDLAKLLKQNGIDIGQKRLFQWMRDNGYLIKQKGNSYNMPTQRSMEAGFFEIKETTVTHADGHITVNKTPKISGKGQVFFVKKFLNGRNE